MPAFYNNPNNPEYDLYYNWFITSDSNACPSGWRMPNNSDFGILMSNASPSALLSEELNGNNSSGFNALPAGYRMINGAFEEVGVCTFLVNQFRHMEFKQSNIRW